MRTRQTRSASPPPIFSPQRKLWERRHPFEEPEQSDSSFSTHSSIEAALNEQVTEQAQAVDEQQRLATVAEESYLQTTQTLQQLHQELDQINQQLQQVPPTNSAEQDLILDRKNLLEQEIDEKTQKQAELQQYLNQTVTAINEIQDDLDDNLVNLAKLQQEDQKQKRKGWFRFYPFKTSTPKVKPLSKMANIFGKHSAVDDFEQALRRTARPFFDLAPFSNIGNQTPHQFIEEFNRLSTASGWDESRMLEIFPAYLKGEPLVVFQDIKPKTDFKWVLTQFVKKLSPSNQAMLWRRKLGNRNQKVDEGVAEFGKYIREAARQAYPDNEFSKQTREILAVEAFREHLRPELFKKIIREPKKNNLAEEIQRAMEEEATQKELKQREFIQDNMVAFARLTLEEDNPNVPPNLQPRPPPLQQFQAGPLQQPFVPRTQRFQPRFQNRQPPPSQRPPPPRFQQNFQKPPFQQNYPQPFQPRFRQPFPQQNRFNRNRKGIVRSLVNDAFLFFLFL
uniref:Gag protein n=1 Tax=Panagrolaimus davidi TaxID=227884 RepID=A0A914Q0B9_9BILA